MFQLCSKLYYASDYKLPWLMKVHSLLDSLGLSYIWSNQIHTIESFKRIVKQRLMDQFIQEWQSRVAENSVCSNYCLFKKKFCFEEYLTYLPSILRQRVLKFRLSNHRLPIQQRRTLGIPRDERICTVCDSGEVGGEFHYLLTVPTKMSRETVLSMLINIIHIIPTCPNFVVSWIWRQNLRISSLLNLLVVFLSYFD